MRLLSKLMNKKSKIRFLRKNQTEPEKIMWERLRNRKFNGLKFKRQYPIGIYIVDFYCFEKKLIIEIDGKSHDWIGIKEYDKTREDGLKGIGNKIIRIKNDEIINDIEKVMEKLYKFI